MSEIEKKYNTCTYQHDFPTIDVLPQVGQAY